IDTWVAIAFAWLWAKLAGQPPILHGIDPSAGDENITGQVGGNPVGSGANPLKRVAGGPDKRSIGTGCSLANDQLIGSRARPGITTDPNTSRRISSQTGGAQNAAIDARGLVHVGPG